MRERVAKLTGLNCDGLWIGTFHSMCARLLRMEARHIGYNSSFTIYDTDDQQSLMKTILKERGIDEKSLQPKSALHRISSYKNSCIPFAELDGTGKSYADRELISIYGAYQDALKRCNAMDFDDLICNTVYLLHGNEEVREQWRKRFEHVLVDEYQDTNTAQFRLIKLFAGSHGRIFVVGDDDQSIYAWRGAKIENILGFAEQFEGTKVFKLEQNYRSTTSILDLANSVIANNTVRADKKLWTAGEPGREVVTSEFRDDRHEADKVSDKIARLLRDGSKPGDVAILYRTNAQSRSFEDVFRKKKIPYVIVGGLSFYERKEIKDCIAYLRIIANPKDDVSFSRIINVPARGIGDKTQEKIAAAALAQNLSMAEYLAGADAESFTGTAKKGLVQLSKLLSGTTELYTGDFPPKDILEYVLKETGYINLLEAEDTEEARGRIENISELLNAIEEFSDDNPDGTLLQFLEQITLVADIDKWEPGQAVTMLTLHSAKGLEFPHVFLTGLENGIMPSFANMDDKAKLEEERRLLYVGITRAMKTLDISYCKSRLRFGQWTIMGPSMLLNSVPDGMYRFVDEAAMFDYFEPDEPLTPRSSPSPSRSFGSSDRFPSRQAGGGYQQPYGRKEPPQPSWKSAARDAAVKPTRKVLEAPNYDEVSQVEVVLRTGLRIGHAEYGAGKIVHVSGFGADTRIEVLFDSGDRKKMMAKFAKFEIL